MIYSLFKNKIDHSPSSPTSEPMLQLIDFNLNNDLKNAIEKAALRFDKDVYDHDHYVLSTNEKRKRKKITEQNRIEQIKTEQNKTEQ